MGEAKRIQNHVNDIFPAASGNETSAGTQRILKHVMLLTGALRSCDSADICVAREALRSSADGQKYLSRVKELFNEQ